jgi:hypothetical protein
MESIKQTAVEWFMEQIGEKQPNGLYVIDTLEDVKNVFIKAKAMEKEQIIDACHEGVDYENSIYKNPEDYYNEQYGGNK